jgi:biotin transport system substrate-specific component
MTIDLQIARRRAVLADLVPGTLARDAVLVLAGAGLTGLAAQAQFTIPSISPVPFTMQTFAVLLVGATLGTWRGAAAMLTYLVAGLAGVPWFAGGASGYTALTAGYLIGFLVAATLVGELARRGGDRNPWRAAGTMVLGNVVVYAIGVPVLAAVTGMSFGTAVAKGAMVFAATDAIKIVLAAGLLPGAWALVSRFSSR